MGNYGYFTLLIGAITPVIGTLGKQNDGGGKVHQFEIFHPSYNWYIGGNKMTGGGKVHQFEAHPYHR